MNAEIRKRLRRPQTQVLTRNEDSCRAALNSTSSLNGFLQVRSDPKFLLPILSPIAGYALCSRRYGTLVENHPVNAESIAHLAKAGGEEHLSYGHQDVTAVGEG